LTSYDKVEKSLFLDWENNELHYARVFYFNIK
jgi:hypothetical protein